MGSSVYSAQKSLPLVHRFTVSLLSGEQSCRLLTCIRHSVRVICFLKRWLCLRNGAHFIWGTQFLNLPRSSIWINCFSAWQRNAAWCFINIPSTSHFSKEVTSFSGFCMCPKRSKSFCVSMSVSVFVCVCV